MRNRVTHNSNTGLRTACEKSLFAILLSAALLPLTANAQPPPGHCLDGRRALG